MVNLVSALILACLLWGRTLARKNVRLHVQVMWFTILADTALVVFLTLSRDVMGTITQRMTLLLSIHIAMALTTVCLYYVAAYWGWQLLRGKREYLARMRIADRIIVPMRIGTLLTSVLLYLTHTS